MGNLKAALHAVGVASVLAMPVGWVMALTGATVSAGILAAEETGIRFLSWSVPNVSRIANVLTGFNAAGKTTLAIISPQLARVGWTGVSVLGSNLLNYAQTGQWLSSAESGTIAASAYGIAAVSQIGAASLAGRMASVSELAGTGSKGFKLAAYNAGWAGVGALGGYAYNGINHKWRAVGH